jgi:hypothetical protein
METLTAILAIVLAGLGSVLAVLAALATRRFGERRFLLLSLAFGLVAITAALAAIAELDLTGIKWFDETFALEPVPLVMFTASLLLVYGVMAAPRRRGGEDRARGA